MQKLNNFLERINVSKHIAKHVVGANHTPKHRKIAGLFVMIIGTSLAHGAGHVDLFFVKIIFDLVGYGIHGIGLIPYLHDIENIDKSFNNEQHTTTNT